MHADGTGHLPVTLCSFVLIVTLTVIEFVDYRRITLHPSIVRPGGGRSQMVGSEQLIASPLYRSSSTRVAARSSSST